MLILTVDIIRIAVYLVCMVAKKLISEVLREAIRHDGRSANQIALAAGVSQGVLSRFLRGERGISLETADRLAVELDLELKPRKGGR